MQNETLSALIKHPQSNQQWVVWIKVAPAYRDRILTDEKLNASISQKLGVLACPKLHVDPQQCEIRVLDPKGSEHAEFMQILGMRPGPSPKNDVFDLTMHVYAV